MAPLTQVKVLSVEEKTRLHARPRSLDLAEVAGDAPFIVYDDRAHAVLGAAPRLECVLEHTAYPWAHEAGVYLPATREVVITSNILLVPEGSEIETIGRGNDHESKAESGYHHGHPNGRQSGHANGHANGHDYEHQQQNHTTDHVDDSEEGISKKTTTAAKLHHRIVLSKLRKEDAGWTREVMALAYQDAVPMANGGTNYRDGVLLCAQGDLRRPSGLVYLPPWNSGEANTASPPAMPLLEHYHGRPFNSPNDVVVAPSDGAVWFTDPHYGWEQGFRPQPRLPAQVYRFDPRTGDVRVVADSFKRPNGICFSPDGRTCYVTDTDWIHGDGGIDDMRVSTIYAMDVVPAHPTEPNTTTLRNRRIFAMADRGVPDGIKCDVWGNVYSGCGDGLSVWSPGGTLLLKVLVPGGVANFCFCEAGELVLLNETRVWALQIDAGHKGALLGI